MKKSTLYDLENSKKNYKILVVEDSKKKGYKVT